MKMQRTKQIQILALTAGCAMLQSACFAWPNGNCGPTPAGSTNFLQSPPKQFLHPRCTLQIKPFLPKHRQTEDPTHGIWTADSLKPAPAYRAMSAPEPQTIARQQRRIFPQLSPSIVGDPRGRLPGTSNNASGIGAWHEYNPGFKINGQPAKVWYF
jgi:hypothetical protein